MFITEDALITPEELHARLGPESLWVLLPYNPLLWSPAKRTGTPMLWLAGDSDVLISEPEERRSAAHYGADYVVVDGAGHNLMTERSCRWHVMAAISSVEAAKILTMSSTGLCFVCGMSRWPVNRTA
jgi:pimeloyl-ACP methyl ester carboxylesterase